MADEILSFIFAGLFIYVGACLWRVRPRAVKKAKAFLWYVVALNAILVLLTLMASFPFHDDRAKAMASAIAALSWLAYLDSSKRVKATYEL
jgi:bacteriorhodopsin